MHQPIYPRSTWGPLPQTRLVPVAWPSATTLYVHHTASPALPPHATVAQECAAMRGIDRFHYYTRGWPGGIGYGFVVFPSGRAYEGRGEHVAAHAPGYNSYPSVALQGDYTAEAPTLAARHAVWGIAAVVDAWRLQGHRQVYPTDCPGDGAMRALVNAPAPTGPAPLAPLPGGSSLRVCVRRLPADPDLVTRGWQESRGALLWIARNGLQPEPEGRGRHWIAWQGGEWFGAHDVTMVARSLVRRFLVPEREAVRAAL